MYELDDLLDNVKTYNFDEAEHEKIKKAYRYAEELHRGQYRQSGEAYIYHPLAVAYILSEMHADCDCICAGLLHDTLEDTDFTKEEIAEEFGADVANLVDGVTKISKMNFSSKEDQNMANTRKIILGITNDVRIIIIKLADRLHNMRTLQSKSEFKRKENSIETMEIFVPIAYYIGAYQIKSELEDLSLQHLKPDAYKKVGDMRTILERDSHDLLEDMLSKIYTILSDHDIPSDIKIRTKNIFGIYKTLSAGGRMSDIHDLLALKVIVDSIPDCYLSLGLIHSEYKPINSRFKDYICNPKTNMYQSLHTCVFGENDRIVQAQIRTHQMDQIATHGLTAYWDTSKGNARVEMQKDLKEKYQFFKSLTEINRVFGDNQDFVKQVKLELFSNKIYVYTTNGHIIELPLDSTPIDFAYSVHTDLGNTLVAAKVNDEYVPLTSRLHSKDRVTVITDPTSFGPREEWLDSVKTTKAKRKIKEFRRKFNEEIS